MLIKCFLYNNYFVGICFYAINILMINIFKFEKLNSTNKFALENIDLYPANSIIQADIQTAGRGRFDRKWISDVKNNCYISFLLKPEKKYKNNFPNLTQYLSIVLCKELEKYNIQANIKWPNDVLVNDKKIAGILSEVAYKDNKINAIVLGIGVNLNLSEEHLTQINIPATSLNLEVGRNIDNINFINDLVESFFKRYDLLLQNGFAEFRAEYISYCNFIGKEVIIKNPNPTCLGMVISIGDDGALEIIDNNGNVQKVYSGDVVLKNS